MATIAAIGGNLSALQIESIFVTEVVKAINNGRSSDTQIFTALRHALKPSNISEALINRASLMYMQRLRSRGYVYENPSNGRWVWSSRSNWPPINVDEIIKILQNDSHLRIGDLLQLKEG